MPTRPLIGIAPHFVTTKSKREMVGTYRSYIHSIEIAGGDCIVLTPRISLIPRYLKLLDGLLLTGGGDIHPRHFGQKMLSKKLDLSPEERTRFEISIAKQFLKTRHPVLGICLGCQTLNVALGGTLIQHLPHQRPEARDHTKGMHAVHLKDSRLKKWIGKSSIRVNSRHHQALDTLGKGLFVSALSHDDVIEAIESDKRSFVVGLQWHPEEIRETSASKKIFSAFVRACKTG